LSNNSSSVGNFPLSTIDLGDVPVNNKHDHLLAPVAGTFELLNSCLFIYQV
jgi:hypothetical protein